jgi:hypothetical protein
MLNFWQFFIFCFNKFISSILFIRTFFRGFRTFSRFIRTFSRFIRTFSRFIRTFSRFIRTFFWGFWPFGSLRAFLSGSVRTLIKQKKEF